MSRKVPSARIQFAGKPVVEKAPPKFQVHKHLQVILARQQFVEIDKVRGLGGLSQEQDFLRDLRREALHLCESLSSFVEGLIENPHYQFSWANSQFSNAATLEVLWRGLDFLTAELEYDGAPTTFLGRVKAWQAELTDQAMRGARSPSQSTSATSNLSELMLTAASADRADKLRWFISYAERTQS